MERSCFFFFALVLFLPHSDTAAETPGGWGKPGVWGCGGIYATAPPVRDEQVTAKDTHGGEANGTGRHGCARGDLCNGGEEGTGRPTDDGVVSVATSGLLGSWARSSPGETWRRRVGTWQNG